MAVKVAGDLYYELDGQLHELKRQLRQPSGYPFDLARLRRYLQGAIEGLFDGEPMFPIWRTLAIGGVLRGELLRRFEAFKQAEKQKGDA